MIHRLIGYAAFLAIGYYIGKEVGRQTSRDTAETPEEAESEIPATAEGSEDQAHQEDT